MQILIERFLLKLRRGTPERTLTHVQVASAANSAATKAAEFNEKHDVTGKARGAAQLKLGAGSYYRSSG